MNVLDKQYLELLQDIIDNGVEKDTRNGNTLSLFGKQIRHKMSGGFPLITTKKMYWKGIVTELVWFMMGNTNIKFLVDNNCHIWDGDAYNNFLSKIPYKTYVKDYLTKEEFINKLKIDDEFAKKWGELGPIYGSGWRNFEGVDQISELIDGLKTNPDSRRLRVSAWQPHKIKDMVLPPCHTDFQVYTRELSLEERLSIADKFNPLIREDCLTKTHHPDETEEQKLQIRHKWLDSLGPNVVPQRRAISLMWGQRSVDTFLGLPFNIASYGLLLEIIAKAVNMVPDELIGNLGDTHLYSNHIEQAKEQIGREPMELPKLNINTEFWLTEGGECGEGPLDAVAIFEGFKNENFCRCLLEEDIQLCDYNSHATIKAPLSN